MHIVCTLYGDVGVCIHCMVMLIGVCIHCMVMLVCVHCMVMLVCTLYGDVGVYTVW